jgi:hypothetical protein
VDPLILSTLTATITALAGGTAGEAGKQAWAALTGLIRAKSSQESPAPALAAELESTPDEPHAQSLVRQLIQDDPTAAEWLRAWLEQAEPLVRAAPEVQNIVAGNAQIHGGNVFQGHTINIQR